MASLPAEAPTQRPQSKAVTTGAKPAAFVPSTLDDAWRIAGALAQSGMTPKAYGGDQNKIMVGIMAGAEIGLTPFAALQSIAVIGNNPSLWGDGALALVQASGLLEDMEETDDGQKATCRLNRKNRATPIIRTFSMDDAKKAGLNGKSGPWTQYPARMRQMRARAFAMRDGFADVLKGLHIVEEARDYASAAGGEVIDLNAKPLSAAMLIEQAAPAEVVEPEPVNDAAAEARQKAKDWTDAHLDMIDQATAEEDLDLIVKGGAGAVAKLKAGHPDLYEEVERAYSVRRVALTQEGRRDEDFGEQGLEDHEDA